MAAPEIAWKIAPVNSDTRAPMMFTEHSTTARTRTQDRPCQAPYAEHDEEHGQRLCRTWPIGQGGFGLLWMPSSYNGNASF